MAEEGNISDEDVLNAISVALNQATSSVAGVVKAIKRPSSSGLSVQDIMTNDLLCFSWVIHLFSKWTMITWMINLRLDHM